MNTKHLSHPAQTFQSTPSFLTHIIPFLILVSHLAFGTPNGLLRFPYQHFLYISLFYLFIAKLPRKNKTVFQKNVNVKFYLSTPWRYGGRDGRNVVPSFLNLGTRCRSLVNFTLRPLFPRGKKPGTHWVALRAGLDVFGGQEDHLPLSGFELQTVQPVGFSLSDYATPAPWEEIINVKAGSMCSIHCVLKR
jgi:hypothetical protein